MSEEQKPLYDQVVELINTPDEAPKFNVSEAVVAAIAKFKKEHEFKSFSARHPELGKMIKCGTCRTRHRSHIKCQQKFVVKYKEQTMQEDGSWGPMYDVLAIALDKHNRLSPGRANVKGRRVKPHLNRRAQMFIERVRKLFTGVEGEDLSGVFRAALQVARKKAARQLSKEYRTEAKRKTRQQEISRRINRGTLRAGYQLEAR